LSPFRRRGSALIIALVILLVLFVMGSGVLSISSQSMRRGHFDALRMQALSVAEAGAERALHYLRTQAPDGTTNGSWRTAGLTEQMGTLGTYTLVVQDGTGDNAGKAVIISTGQVRNGSSGQITRTTRVVAKITREDISIWNNAIFGGVGQAGRSINGNVAVRGSMHLLGDGEPWTDLDGDQRWDAGDPFSDSNGNGAYNAGEPFTDADGDGHRDAREAFNDVNGNGTCDPPLTVTDLSSEFGGSASIGNNYDIMPSDLRSLVPAPPTTNVQGEMVETLSAKLRAKHGYVSLSGTATVGFPDVSGGAPARKETLDGTYVSDGFGGTAGATNVYTDNSAKAKYDLGDGLVSFPNLTDPTVKNGVSYPSYMSYLAAQGLVVNGGLQIEPGTSFGPILDAKGNYLAVDTNGNMIIRGIVYVNGDIRIERDGGDREMRYTGRGTLVSTGNISIDSSLIPAGATFPVNHVMGFIARRAIRLGTGGGSAQLRLAGAYYAQEQIASEKQNELLGTFVSSYFSMQNVPHMYQVPSLPDNLPPGMPGSGRIWVKTVRLDSWREVAGGG
jgi:hypothetical protein